MLEFRSGQPNAYDWLMLKTRKPVPEQMSAKQYQEALEACADDDSFLERLNLAAAAPSAKRARVDKEGENKSNNDQDGDDDICGDDAPETPEMLPGPEPLMIEDVAGDVIAGSDVVARDYDDVVGDGPAAEIGPEDIFPDEVEGVRLRRVAGKHDARWSYNPRLAVVCPWHLGRARSRSVALDVEALGPFAAMLHLGCWLRAGATLNAQGHTKYPPTRADVRSYESSL